MGARVNQTFNLGLGDVLKAVEAYGLFSALATVQRFNGALGPTGQEAKEVDANWVDLASHVSLPCMDARDLRPTIGAAREKKGPEAIASISERHILLDGCFPAILSTDRLIVTSVHGDVATLDITGVEHDSQGIMTRLGVVEYKI